MTELKPTVRKRSTLRQRIQVVKPYQCKNLIVVLEEPNDIKNIGAVIRNVNALGAEKLYLIDSRGLYPNDWQVMRERKSLLATSASAVKWSFVKVFPDTQTCIEHLNNKDFVSVVTSPHIKGKNNVILHEGDYTQKRLSVWFGNESRGVSDLAVANAEACINIEMFGVIESLNLGMSAGIVLYEITKQRRDYQTRYKRGHKRNPKVSSKIA